MILKMIIILIDTSARIILIYTDCFGESCNCVPVSHDMHFFQQLLILVTSVGQRCWAPIWLSADIVGSLCLHVFFLKSVGSNLSMDVYRLRTLRQTAAERDERRNRYLLEFSTRVAC